MKIHVAALTADPKTVDFLVSLSELLTEEEAPVFAEAVRFTGTLHRLGAKIYIRGEALGRARMSCSRCLEEFEADVRASIDTIAVPDGVESPLREGEAMAAEEGMILAYRHDELDLGPEIRTAMLLALPMKPLCSEACPGLCTRCGWLRGGAQCRCETEPRENPFARLKAMEPGRPPTGHADRSEAGGNNHGQSKA